MISQGQITISDLNDITVGLAAPVSPTVDQMWCDTSVEPNIIKKWNGSSWVTIGSQIFRVQPTTAQAYNIGDLWLNATVGSWTNELLKCITAKASGVAFNVAHWVLATKYTDDTAVNNLQIGGRNLLMESKGDFIADDTQYVVKNFGYVLDNVPGRTYTLSCEAIVDLPYDNTHVMIVAYDDTWGIVYGAAYSTPNNTEWEFISTTFTVPIDYTGQFTVGLWNYPNNNGGCVRARNVKLEDGTKATGWSPAPEDTALKIATVEAKANLSEAITNKFGTTVDGGLIQTVMMLLRGLTETETAGISGIQGDGTSPAFWAGGTYAEAIANIAKTIFNHDGSGHLAGGNLWWDILGKLFFGKEGDGESIKISLEAIPTLAEINNREFYNPPVTEESILRDLNNPADDGIDVNSTFSQEFTLEHDGTLNVSAMVSYGVGTAVEGFGIDGNIYIEKLNGTTWENVYAGELIDTFSLSLEPWQVPILKGCYRLRWEVACGWTSVQGFTATISVYRYCEITYKLDVKRVVVGINGIALMDSMSDNMFRLSLTDANYLLNVIGGFKWSSPDRLKYLEITNSGVKISGATDIPGVLAAGSIIATEGQVSARRWGAKADYTHDATKVSAGYYRVPVLADNANYTINIAPRAAQRTFYIGAQTSTYFDVYFYVGSTLTDTAFDFQIFGNNA